MHSFIASVLAYLCQTLPLTSYCEQRLVTPAPPPPPAIFAAAPIVLPTKAGLLESLEQHARIYIKTAPRDHANPSVRRVASRRLRYDLRALAVMPLTADERRDVCSNEVLGRVRDAIIAQPNSELMKAYLLRACPSKSGDNFVPRMFSRYALYAGQSFVHPRPGNAYARAQARDWLRFIIARGDLRVNDWRAVLMYSVQTEKGEELHPEFFGAALADAVDGDWSKIGFKQADVLALARRALGDLEGRAGRKRLRSIARAYRLTPEETNAVKLSNVEPPRRD